MKKYSIRFKKNPQLHSNLDRLSKIQPRLVDRIKSFIKGKTGFDYTVDETTTGSWIRGLTSEPFFEPKKKSFSREIRHEGYPIAYIMGRGSRQYLKDSMDGAPTHTKFFVIIESSLEMVIDTLCALNFSDPYFEQKAVLFLVDTDKLKGSLGDVEEFINIRGAYIATLANFIIHRGENELFEGELKDRIDALMKTALYRVRMLGNAAEDTMWGFRQTALNVPWMVEGEKLQALKDGFKGIPAVVVAAGPSLDKNVHLLKALQGKVVIVAVETVLKKLMSMGIKPHFVVALERDFVVYEKHFAPAIEMYGDQLKDVVLVSQAVCVSLVAGRWPGPVAVVGKEGLLVDKIFLGGTANVPAVESGASAANTCLGVAAYIGSSPVALIGQDLAFGGNGVSHATGTAWEKGGGVEKGMAPYPVRGWHGDTVYTHWAWDYFKDCFNDIIPKLNISVFDCTEGGADIEKAQNMAFNEWIDRFCFALGDPVFDEKLLSRLREGSSEHRFPLEKISERLEIFRRQFDVSLEKIAAGLEALEKVSQDRSKEENLADAEAMAMALKESQEGNPLLSLAAQGAQALLRSQWHVVQDMDNPSDLQIWKDSHGEFFQSLKLISDFYSYWLKTMAVTLDMMTSGEIVSGQGNVGPLATDVALPMMEELLSDDGDDIQKHISLDNLYARCGKLSYLWTPETFRRFARHFIDSGRYIEAQSLLTVAVRSMEGRSVTRPEAFITLTLWALSLSSQDLNQEPSPRQAYRALKDAWNYCDEPENLSDLLSRVLQVRQLQLRTAYENAVYDKDHALMQELDRWIVSLDEAISYLRDDSVQAVNDILGNEDRPIDSFLEKIDRAFGEKTLKVGDRKDDKPREGGDSQE